MRWRLLAVVALAACYEPPQTSESCAITCTEGTRDNCPGDLVCEGGYCVGPGQVCRPSFVQTTAGTGFGCSIDDAGALWCWGILTGTTVATRIDNTRHWQSIDAGGGQICGIANEQLFCWGENNDREVSGTVADEVVAAPLEIVAAGVTRWSAVSAGVDHTCAVGDGQLLCWGENGYGQLGDGTTTDRGVPTPVAAAIVDWTAVATGDRHTCAISTMYGVHCFGENRSGELGVNGGAGSSIPVSVTLQGAAFMATKIAVATETSCAIVADGTPYCWGYNYYGQLGDRRLIGDPTVVIEVNEPTRASDVPGFTEIEGANYHFCALAGDAVYCWGSSNLGGIGAGIWADSRVFQKAIAAGATDISVGQARDAITSSTLLDLGCAIVGADTQCWGDNRYGQLGRGTTTMAVTPTEVAGNHRFTDVSAGAHHMCGIGDDGVLYCWGSTERGQATGFIYGGGVPRMPCAPNPTDPMQPLCDVGAPRALTYAPNPTSIATGNAFSCALSGGIASCWGTGLTGGNALKRDLQQPAAAMWKTLMHTGRDAQCGTAQMPNDPVYCVGNIFNATLTPTRAAQLDGFRTIQLGGNPAFGVFLDGTGLLYGAGDNGYFQMGDGTQLAYGSLTAIAPARRYTAISTRSVDGGSGQGDANFVCGIRESDQKVECWGRASRGQTGASVTNMDTMTPNEVPNLSGCTAIATGVEHACAICGGEVQCWGDNRSSQLAAPQSAVVSSLPRRIEIPLSGDPWVQIVAGSRFSCARSETGRVFCWGLSEHGALGNGATGANLPLVVQAQID